MKKLMITAALVASLVSLGYSQDQSKQRPAGPRRERPEGERKVRTPEERAQIATDAMEKKLNLSAEQKSKVFALNLDRAQKMEKNMKANQEFRKEQMEKNKAAMEDTDKKLSKILTEEQKKTYDEMKQQSRERMKNHSRPGVKKKSE